MGLHDIRLTKKKKKNFIISTKKKKFGLRTTSFLNWLKILINGMTQKIFYIILYFSFVSGDSI